MKLRSFRGRWKQPFRTVALGLSLLLIFTAVERNVLGNAWQIVSGAQFDYRQGDYLDGEFWAEEILGGGYILHFRHAERDKWIDVQMYDLLEDRDRKAMEPLATTVSGMVPRPGHYFDGAVCLNLRGETQARAMWEVIKAINLPVGDVYSSVSCRAKQTALLSFSSSPIISRLLLHRGPFAEVKAGHLEDLRDFYQGLSPAGAQNTIISSHNDVVSKEMFLNQASLDELSLEEGGFYVISVTPEGLILEHEFHSFWDFAHLHFPRE